MPSPQIIKKDPVKEKEKFVPKPPVAKKTKPGSSAPKPPATGLDIPDDSSLM